jgi:hypothetical protein
MTQKSEPPLFDRLPKLFEELINIKLLTPTPSEFKSSSHNSSVGVYASEGFLFPMDELLIHIYKPLRIINLKSIKKVEFQRMKYGTYNFFDITVVKKKHNYRVIFRGIYKDEQKHLVSYFQSKKVKIYMIGLKPGD